MGGGLAGAAGGVELRDLGGFEELHDFIVGVWGR
jgi:hypothetical protein